MAETTETQIQGFFQSQEQKNLVGFFFFFFEYQFYDLSHNPFPAFRPNLLKMVFTDECASYKIDQLSHLIFVGVFLGGGMGNGLIIPCLLFQCLITFLGDFLRLNKLSLQEFKTSLIIKSLYEKKTTPSLLELILELINLKGFCHSFRIISSFLLKEMLLFQGHS